ncbi:MAG: sialidase family protein [Rhodoferax sp.]|nr:sialidase family protein [Rhodoferax sp.]
MPLRTALHHRFLDALGRRPWGSVVRGVVLRLVLALIAIAALLLWDQARRPTDLGPAQAEVPGIVLNGQLVQARSLRRVAQGDVPMPPDTQAAHASSLLPMPDGDPAALTLFWFSGERESGPLVQIAATQWDRTGQAWLPPRFVVNRQVMGDALGYALRRLGNPVVWRDRQGRMHLYVVATGWGGWAASRVLHLRQSSASARLDDLTFEPMRTLPLSWLWNTSFLVRNAPMPLQDGGMVLPLHFELGLKYPALVRVGADGDFVGLERVSARNYMLQPSVLPISATQWVALMRDERSNGRVTAARTDDGGQHWIDLPDLPLGNPDAAVAAMTLSPGQNLLAYNPTPEGRARLDLRSSSDGLDWQPLTTLAQGSPEAEFSYPALAWADGALWISYTVDRATLSWQRFAPMESTP